MWLHFTHLFWRIVHGMPVLVSSNWASWLILIGTFLLTQGLLLGRARLEGEDMRQWWANRWKNLGLGFLVTAIVYASLFLWSTVQTVYDDHHDSTGRWQAVVKEKNDLKGLLSERDQYITQLQNRSCPICTQTLKKDASLCLHPAQAKLEFLTPSSVMYESKITISNKNGIPMGTRFAFFFGRNSVMLGTIKDSDGKDLTSSMSSATGGSGIASIGVGVDVPKGKALVVTTSSWELPVKLVCVDRISPP
jgi:hypothetical protein